MAPPFVDVEGELRDALRARCARTALPARRRPARRDHRRGRVAPPVASRARLDRRRPLPSRGPRCRALRRDRRLGAREAAQQLATWRRRFDSWRFPVSVNVSAADFDERLVHRIVDLAPRYGSRPGRCAIDIAEPELMRDPQRGRALVVGSRMPVRRSSSTTSGPACRCRPETRTTAAHPRRAAALAAALEALPVDVVKVDRELSAAARSPTPSTWAVEINVKLAHQLGFRLLAEGVETGDEAEWLRQAGFDLGQGYYFQRPHGPGHRPPAARPRRGPPPAAVSFHADR